MKPGPSDALPTSVTTILLLEVTGVCLLHKGPALRRALSEPERSECGQAGGALSCLQVPMFYKNPLYGNKWV